MKILAPGQFFATFAALTGVFSSAGSLAQLVEHNTFNVGVSGSSPERATCKERVDLMVGSLFLLKQTP